MKWSIHAAVVLRVPKFASMPTMLICGIRPIVLLRSMSPDRMSVATKPAIIPFSAFPIIRPDSTFLFDHLVGKSEQFFRNFDTKPVRGFEVDHELDFVGCRTAFLTYQDCAQLGLEERSRGRFSSNVNGTTACMSHVSGITGVRHIIDGNTEYNGYSWPICGWTWNAIGGWTSNSGLNPTVASWAIAAEAKMSIDPAARANCKDFRIVFLRRFLFAHRRIELCQCTDIACNVVRPRGGTDDELLNE